MHSSIYFPSSPFFSTKTISTFSNTTLFPATHHHHHHHHHQSIKKSSTLISIKAKAATSDIPEVDYNSMTASVFPAEACETLGGVACDVEMFPETKLTQPEPNPNPKQQPTAQAVDREYLQYNTPKTVFIQEACDDLGGEFCDPAYQDGAN